jgi:hypothetical protein
MRRRPLGITILAVLSFVTIALYGVLLAMSVAAPGALAALLKALSPGGSGPEMQLQMGRALPFYYVFGLLLSIAIAVGLWKLQQWARIVVLVMLGISAAGLFATAAGVFRGGAGAIALWLLRLGLCALVRGYLFSGGVRAAFRRVPHPSSAAA